ncbi:MAG: cobalamin B12-binding domain-containing protein, partial [Candidatus Omnitrophica bacterium]|nr:cobalamin B12-binding domain-containing protein [Candidatus Omnitrophota bacterium]
MNKPDLLLINPGNKKVTYGKLSEVFSGIEPPVWTGLLASFIRDKGFEVAIIDADAEKLSTQEIVERIVACDPILIGVGTIGANPSAASTPKMAAASQVLKLLKAKQLKGKTVAYGIHVSALPEKTLKEEAVDFVCRGESFYPILELLKTLKTDQEMGDLLIKGLWYVKNGKVIANGWADLIKDLD